METYGLIGFPLGHSFSKSFFSDKFLKESIDAQYLNFEIEDLRTLSDIIKKSQIKGFNVTIPHKETILPLLNSIDPEAEQIGAVNVVRVTIHNGKIYLRGYNSDCYGFRTSIAPLLNSSIHKSALILGTGGASKAVKYGLESLGLSTLYVSRNTGKNRITYNKLNDTVMQQNRVIVNCTPLGTFPEVNNCPNIPYHFLTSEHLLYDLVYNPEETLFLKKGKSHGAQIKNGYEMLELQAIKSWEIWNDIKK